MRQEIIIQDWEQGSISSSGADISTDNRIRSVNYIETNCEESKKSSFTIFAKTYAGVRLHSNLMFYDFDKNCIYDSGWDSYGETLIFNKDIAFIRIILKHPQDNTNIHPQELSNCVLIFDNDYHWVEPDIITIDYNRKTDLHYGSLGVDAIYQGTTLLGNALYNNNLVLENTYPKFFDSMIYRNEFSLGKYATASDYNNWKYGYLNRRTIESYIDVGADIKEIVEPITPYFKEGSANEQKRYEYNLVFRDGWIPGTSGTDTYHPYTDYNEYLNSSVQFAADYLSNNVQVLGITNDEDIKFKPYYNKNFRDKGFMSFHFGVENGKTNKDWDYFLYNGTYLKLNKEFLSGNFTINMYLSNELSKNLLTKEDSTLISLTFGDEWYWIKQSISGIDNDYAKGGEYVYDEDTADLITTTRYTPFYTNIHGNNRIKQIDLCDYKNTNYNSKMLTITKQDNKLSLYVNFRYWSSVTLTNTVCSEDGKINYVLDNDGEEEYRMRYECSDCCISNLYLFTEALSLPDIRFLYEIMRSDEDITEHKPFKLYVVENPLASEDNYNAHPYKRQILWEEGSGDEPPIPENFSTIKVYLYYTDGSYVDVSKQIEYSVDIDHPTKNGINTWYQVTGSYTFLTFSDTFNFRLRFVSNYYPIIIEELDDDLESLGIVTSYSTDKLVAQYLKTNWFRKYAIKSTLDYTTNTTGVYTDSTRLSGAYSDCDSLYKADFPNLIRSTKNTLIVGNECYGLFKDCGNLTEVTFSNESYTSAGYTNRDFMHCNNLETVNFPNSQPNIVKAWFPSDAPVCQDNGVYWKVGKAVPQIVDTNVQEVTLEEGITIINGNTWNSSTQTYNPLTVDCNNLTTLNLPNTLTTVNTAYLCKDTAISEINIPSNVTYIHPKAFEEYTGIINIDNVEGAIQGAPWGGINATINYLKT